MVSKRVLTVVGATLCLGIAIYATSSLIGISADKKIEKAQKKSSELALEVAKLEGQIQLRDEKITKLDNQLDDAKKSLADAEEETKRLKKPQVIIKTETAEQACNKIAELYGDSTSKIIQDGIAIKLQTTTQMLFDAESFIKNYPIKVAESENNYNKYVRAKFALEIAETSAGERQLKINDLNNVIAGKNGIITQKENEIDGFKVKLKTAETTSTLEKVAIGVGSFAVGYFVKDKLKR